MFCFRYQWGLQALNFVPVSTSFISSARRFVERVVFPSSTGITSFELYSCLKSFISSVRCIVERVVCFHYLRGKEALNFVPVLQSGYCYRDTIVPLLPGVCKNLKKLKTVNATTYDLY